MDIVVFQTVVTQNAQPKATVQFFSPEGPTTVEVRVGGSGTQYKPIGGSMVVTMNGKPVSIDNMITTGDLVDLSLFPDQSASGDYGIKGLNPC